MCESMASGSATGKNYNYCGMYKKYIFKIKFLQLQERFACCLYVA